MERLFETLQDRLVKGMRLQGISTIEEANKFLETSYWAGFNKKFMLIAQYEKGLHRGLPKSLKLNAEIANKREKTLASTILKTGHF